MSLRASDRAIIVTKHVRAAANRISDGQFIAVTPTAAKFFETDNPADLIGGFQSFWRTEECTRQSRIRTTLKYLGRQIPTEYCDVIRTMTGKEVEVCKQTTTMVGEHGQIIWSTELFPGGTNSPALPLVLDEDLLDEHIRHNGLHTWFSAQIELSRVASYTVDNTPYAHIMQENAKSGMVLMGGEKERAWNLIIYRCPRCEYPYLRRPRMKRVRRCPNRLCSLPLPASENM